MNESAETKLHILQVHNYYPIAGGEDQVVSVEGKLLKKHGHSVYFYGRRNEEISRMNFFQKLCMPFATIFSFKTFREVKGLIEGKKIDIVHVHNTFPLISPSVFYAAFACRVPVVMTVHNFRLLCPGADFYRRGKVCEECVHKGLFRSVKYGCYRESRAQTLLCALSLRIHRLLGTYGRIHYICLTDFNKKKLLNLKQIKPEKVFVKPNFMTYGEEVVPASQRENYFLYGGRLEEEKGVKILLEAFRILSESHDFGAKEENMTAVPRLLLCGEGSLKEWCLDYASKHKLTNVSVKGGMPGEIIRKLMSKAKGVIVPSLWYEGFPMVMAEAFSVRTPVIGSDLGNVGHLIEENVNGVKFRSGDAKDLADVLRDFDPAEICFDAGRQKMKEWDEEENYRKLMEIYERCIRDVRKAKEK